MALDVHGTRRVDVSGHVESKTREHLVQPEMFDAAGEGLVELHPVLDVSYDADDDRNNGDQK